QKSSISLAACVTLSSGKAGSRRGMALGLAVIYNGSNGLREPSAQELTMAGQLLPPSEIAPALPPDLTPQQRVALWVEWVDVCDEFLRSGLRRRIGPDGDWRAAYRAWYVEQMAEHDAMMIHLMEQFEKRSKHGG